MNIWRQSNRIVSLALATFVGTAALGQSANYESIDIAAGTPVQLSYHSSANKDCTPAPLPRVRVSEVPKFGMLTVRRAVLMTDKVEGCPQIKVPARVVLYEVRAGSAGADHVAYEVTSENGEVATYDVTITVKPGPAPSPQRTPL